MYKNNQMPSYFKKRIRHTKFLTADQFQLRKKYKMKWFITVGKMLAVICIAFILAEYAFAIEQIKSICISLASVLILYFVCWMINFLRTPTIFSARLRKVIKKKEKIIANRENKNKVVEKIKEFLKNHDIYNPHNYININTEAYHNALIILENNSSISIAAIEIFKNDHLLNLRYPGHGLYGGKLRIFFLKDIILSFSEIKVCGNES